jgi:dolichyl-diphosphooligosaccharide--protein glycosyltransferase
MYWAGSGPNRKLVRDYYDGYKWLDANTPRDARVMAWWDYGYQITGIGRRTSIADGNTWNHEHIATLGRTLTSPEKKAWNAIRHLADYVLVWAGGGGDDLAKSPHLARIGNSVFPEHCGDDDPRCNKFGFYDRQRTPTPMMGKSLLYKLVSFRTTPGVTVDERLFQEVHITKHGLMRVYKVMNVSEESKAWIAEPANRVCDAPGSWYCVGQYPPALHKLIAMRRNFAQLEDFNRGSGQKSAYSKLVEAEQRGEKRDQKKEL